MSDEIENLIKIQSGFVVIQLTETFYSVENEIDLFREKIENKFGMDVVSFVKTTLSQHRDWAEKFGIHGSPATLIFKDGKLFLRVIGRFHPEQLINKFFE